METIYYKVVYVWDKYPWHNELVERYAEFYRKNKKTFVKIEGLKIYSNTSIQEKESYLKDKIKIEKVKVLKIK